MGVTQSKMIDVCFGHMQKLVDRYRYLPLGFSFRPVIEPILVPKLGRIQKFTENDGVFLATKLVILIQTILTRRTSIEEEVDLLTEEEFINYWKDEGIPLQMYFEDAELYDWLQVSIQKLVTKLIEERHRGKEYMREHYPTEKQQYEDAYKRGIPYRFH